VRSEYIEATFLGEGRVPCESFELLRELKSLLLREFVVTGAASGGDCEGVLRVGGVEGDSEDERLGGVGGDCDDPDECAREEVDAEREGTVTAVLEERDSDEKLL
jgi:hypothetical protein